MMLLAFLLLYHQDKANAAIHCAPVKFSPLTFRLGKVLFDRWPEEEEDIDPALLEVEDHRGRYEEDRGR